MNLVYVNLCDTLILFFVLFKFNHVLFGLIPPGHTKRLAGKNVSVRTHFSPSINHEFLDCSK